MSTPELVREYYPYEQCLKSEYFIVNGKKEGEYKEYYHSMNYPIDNETVIGGLFIKCNYSNDKIEGEYCKYFDEGNLLIICVM